MEKSVGNEKYVAYHSLSSFNDNPIILIMGEEEKCQSGMFTEFLPTVYTYLHREERKEKVTVVNRTEARFGNIRFLVRFGSVQFVSVFSGKPNRISIG